MEYASKSRGGVCSHREIGAVAEDHVAGRPIDSSTAFAAFAAGTAAPAAASISAAADCPASTAATSADAPALFCTLRPDRAVSADVIPRPDKRGPAQRPNGPTAQRPWGDGGWGGRSALEHRPGLKQRLDRLEAASPGGEVQGGVALVVGRTAPANPHRRGVTQPDRMSSVPRVGGMARTGGLHRLQ